MFLTSVMANTAWMAGNFPAAAAFTRALRDPEAAQLLWLKNHLEANRDCAFARQHRLHRVRSAADFANLAPVMEPAELDPWVRRIRQGETGILTTEPVTHLVPTSGSTGGRKLIPFTAGLQGDFDRAVGPWLCDLARQHPDVLGGPAYWSVSPPWQEPPGEDSAVPIGFADDTEYLGGLKGWLARAMLVRPPPFPTDVALEDFHFGTLRALVAARSLRLISVWHPSFLTLLLDALPKLWENLTAAFPASAGLRRADPLRPETIWPRLRVVSCWGDAHAGMAMDALRSRLPHSAFQAKGLLATEGAVTIPWQTFRPLAIRSHFFEFRDESGSCLQAHELKTGQSYEIILTTSGGLWRYRLGDRVLCDGFAVRTPSLRFLGRTGAVCDLAGEKLSEEFVVGAIREATRLHKVPPEFALMAPQRAPAPGYVVYFEGENDAEIADRLELILCRNPHYLLCRKLGQLSRLVVQPVIKAWPAYVRQALDQGMRLGDIKPQALSSRSAWADIFVTNTSPSS